MPIYYQWPHLFWKGGGLGLGGSGKQCYFTWSIAVLPCPNKIVSQQSCHCAAWEICQRRDLRPIFFLLPHTLRHVVKPDAGNYTCHPANLNSASIRLHVVNGERIHYSKEKLLFIAFEKTTGHILHRAVVVVVVAAAAAAAAAAVLVMVPVDFWTIS